MNEMKPEDVMMALDILDKMDFFQGQRAGRELWNDKPYEVQEQDIADFSQGIATVKKVIEDALALLREKDALIAELTQTNAEKDKDVSHWELLTNSAIAAVKRQSARIKEKDSEIDWLKLEIQARVSHIKFLQKEREDARAKAITEFAELMKKEVNGNQFSTYRGTEVRKVIDQIAKEMKGEENGGTDL